MAGQAATNTAPLAIANSEATTPAKSTAVPTIATQSPSKLAKNEIAIDGHLYISTKAFASRVGFSERTFSRRCTNGGGPPGVKVAGTHYELDKVQAWAKNKGYSW